MDLIQALTPNEQKLVFVSAVFGLYLIAILAFAAVYYLRFSRVPSSFVFAANIVEGQRSNRLAETQQSIRRLESIDRVIAIVSENLRDQPDVKIYPGKWEMKTDAGTLRYLNIGASGAPSAVAEPSPMMVVDTGGNSDLRNYHKWVAGRGFFGAMTISKLRQEIVRERGSIRKRRERAALMEESFRSGSPHIWTFTDFIYFSTIIQSTVGLGDIQPNSTKIRVIVILQILLGYTILIVILNLILGWQWRAQ
jgi:hypothetical protein